MKSTYYAALFILTSSCSFIGIQNEEGPKYKVILKENNFEIREYAPYISAQVTLMGDFNKSPGEAFKILAGYIFGRNMGKENISMTSPVKMKQEPMKIAMTTPVKTQSSKQSYTMSFSMPSKYALEDLPEPNDKRIKFKQEPAELIASHKFSGLRSKKKNLRKFQELKQWLSLHHQYKAAENFSFAGYNPPWTLPFMRRNEVHVKLQKK